MLMEEFKKDIVRIVSKKIPITESMLTIPPNPELGDFSLPCFVFSKELKKSPDKIAKWLEKELEPTPLIEVIKAAGPYINFFMNKAKFAELVLGDVMKLKENYGKSLFSKGKRTMVEFSSPNTNKPLHLGHVRNTLLGMSISAILKACGHDVIKATLFNDRGIHICNSMLAYKKWGNNQNPDIKADHFVGKFYKMFNEWLKKDPKLEDEARELLRLWEQKDKETISLWKRMNNWAYIGFNETYEMLGINFDERYYESELYEKGKKLVADAAEKGIFKKQSDGSIIAELEDVGLPNKILIRADGTSLYVTQDIYLAKLKFEQHDINKSLYVVGSEQNLHFQQLFAILKKLGFDFWDKCEHISHGMVYLPEGRLKSREGTVVDADEIIQEVLLIAEKELKKRYEKINEKELHQKAKAIGLAALKFFMLKFDPAKDMLYDPKESISFEGETGPYVQYAYARINSVIEKYGKSIPTSINYTLLKEREHKLIRIIADFPMVVENAAKSYKPSIVAHYLLSLAQEFNEFYQFCPILQEKEGLREARIVVINGVRQVLKNGLALLGIEAIEKM